MFLVSVNKKVRDLDSISNVDIFRTLKYFPNEKHYWWALNLHLCVWILSFPLSIFHKIGSSVTLFKLNSGKNVTVIWSRKGCQVTFRLCVFLSDFSHSSIDVYILSKLFSSIRYPLDLQIWYLWQWCHWQVDWYPSYRIRPKWEGKLHFC